MRLLIALCFAGIGIAAQSVQVTSGALAATLPSGAPWNTVGSSTSPSRWEMRLHNFGGGPSWSFSITLPPLKLYIGNGNQLLYTYTHNPPAGDQVSDAVPGVIPCCAGRTDILIRLQRDVANRRYTLELCDVTGGNCSACTGTIIAFGQDSWVGWQHWLSAGYQMAFLRWFSTVVPVGTLIPIGGVSGDRGDWEFEGNLNDWSGHGLNMAGGTAGFSATPVYPPACNVGAQQSFRAGFPGRLDGTGSQPLDGGTALTYLWQQTTRQRLVWSSHTAAQPTVRGLVSGPANFQLTVTDASGQSSTCSVDDGAVATDDNDIVITGNASVDTLLGPMVRLGANPWPWFDDRNKKLADLQIAAMDTNSPDYWDTAAAGTVSVSPTQACSGSAVGACLIGSGTTFTSTFTPGAFIVIWWNNGANRRLDWVSSIIDDTHLILTYAWDGGTTESGIGYSAPSAGAVYGMSFAQQSTPGNYYDNVEAYYALYYRSGIDTYLNAARTLADRFWASPAMDKGSTSPGYQFKYAGRSESLTGMFLRALELGGNSSMWPGLRNRVGSHIYNLTVLDLPAHYGISDQREVAYDLLYVDYCALFDPDATQRAACQAAISGSFSAIGNHYAVWQPARAADGSFPSLEFATVDTSHSVTATHGSTTIAGNGTAWTTGQFSAVSPLLLYFPFGTVPASNNAGFDTVTYVPVVVNATTLTLDQPFQGTTGTYGWSIGNGYGVMGWGNQPFMEGIQTVAFALAGRVLASSDPVTSALAYNYAAGLANWLKTYGYSNPAYGGVGGMYYFTSFVNCAYPVQTSLCTEGYTASQARTDAAEAVRGMSLVYAQTGDQALRNFIDTVYSEMYSKPGTSSQFPGDGQYISDLNDGQSFMDSGHGGNKWLGFFFGFDNGAAWPGYRVGGVQPGDFRRAYVAFGLAGVRGATQVRVTTTAPDSTISETVCSSSPCAVTVDRRQGDHLIQLQYLSASGAILASTESPVIQAP
jgi:hypothetical protein